MNALTKAEEAEARCTCRDAKQSKQSNLVRRVEMIAVKRYIDNLKADDKPWLRIPTTLTPISNKSSAYLSVRHIANRTAVTP